MNKDYPPKVGDTVYLKGQDGLWELKSIREGIYDFERVVDSITIPRGLLKSSIEGEINPDYNRNGTFKGGCA